MSLKLSNYIEHSSKVIDEIHNILENLVFDKIYKRFNEEYKVDDTAAQKCNKIKDELSIHDENEELILNFCKILYKLIVKSNGWQNDDYEEIPEENEMYCLHLKYWLYENVENGSQKGLNIGTDFQNWKDKLENQISANLKYPCTFNELSWSDISKIRSIYAFILIYYSNLQAFNKNKQIKCKYMDYLGKGLKEYHESINICSGKNEQEKYCKEFKEFQKIYKEDKLYWRTSKADREYKYEEDNTYACSLNIETLDNPLHLTYWHDKEKLHLSNQVIDFQKSTIISASSAIGATVGISAFLLYLYKNTSLGSLFRVRAQKDNMILNDMDEGTHSLILPTQYENSSFENSDYKITYYSLNNS
ncbi:PIR Superfamily Protein [Plasmodium ovale wallikeri]|uniref:PIR Superfamily Protein n=1 Tax=Plasmodium ovale wallikeri TaxID=864142 RepID=A0A1A9ANH2_PLAOA|nr:PIR Superfamily Protein [Plasmodium ovale wallikeri]SBT57762.1 PIR Superfamily Protein [Plasmodium ovale wallikeri]